MNARKHSLLFSTYLDVAVTLNEPLQYHGIKSTKKQSPPSLLHMEQAA